MGKYFGTDGFRGEANEVLTVEHAFKVGRFLGWYYGQDHKAKVVIGKDTRRSSYMFEYALVAGLTASGASAYLLHVTTTPSVSYVTRTENFDCGIMISASHNPYEFNGIKYFSNKGMKIPDSLEEEIEEIMESGKLDELTAENEKIGVSEYSADLIDEYVYFFRKNFDDNIAKYNKEDFVVGIDTANGATSFVAEKVFSILGIKYKIINNNPDGVNINCNCGSTHLENLKKYVIENKLSLGIAFDGD